MKAILDNFAQLLAQQSKCTIRGRVVKVRQMGSNLCFADISNNGSMIQVMASSSKELLRGDIVEIQGEPMTTSSNEPTIKAEMIKVLKVCQARHEFPSLKTGLVDSCLRESKRHLDLLMNSLPLFRQRSYIIKEIRQFMWREGFEEVETPILSKEAGGALAEPFVIPSSTHGNGDNLYLRIAPELYLKRCLIGGMEKVFELGKVFRNEGLDSSHQPEFTSLEFYWAYSALEDMMHLTNNIIRHFIPSMEPIRVNLIDSLEDALNTRFPHTDDQEAWRYQMIELCRKHEIPFNSNEQLHNLFDKLVSKFVETQYAKQSVYFMYHPQFCSPLAKSTEGKSLRFELFIEGLEVANGYEELDDHEEQLQRFTQQAREQARTVSLGDMDYVEALRLGMPPATGCGIGIDRLIMKCLQQRRINDVILFPH